MTTSSSKSARLSRLFPVSLVPLALLLGATPERVFVQGPLPVCPRGNLLTVHDGVLQCQDLVAGLAQAPRCDGQLLAPKTAGGAEWMCTPKGQFDAQALAELPAMTERAGSVLAQAIPLGGSQRPGSGVYVGSTTVQTNGFIQRAGTEAGILSANALCSDEFAGAHMCNGYELHASVSRSILRPGIRLQKAWIFHPAWKTPVGPAQNAEEGLADTCASYTYGKIDRGWSGIAAEYGPTAYNALDAALAFNGGAAAPCSAVLPIACCK